MLRSVLILGRAPRTSRLQRRWLWDVGSSKPTRFVEKRRLDIDAATLFRTVMPPGRSFCMKERGLSTNTKRRRSYQVLDVDTYQEFLPFCVASKVTERTSGSIASGDGSFQADLTLGFEKFSASYSSRVTFSRLSQPAVWSIRATSTKSSLFSRMESSWVGR